MYHNTLRRIVSIGTNVAPYRDKTASPRRASACHRNGDLTLALKKCAQCGKKYADKRVTCPYCRRVLSEFSEEYRQLQAAGFKREVPTVPAKTRMERRQVMAMGFFLMLILSAANIWQAATRDDGPDPESEGLHSPEAAEDFCRRAIADELADDQPRIREELLAEYLGGGEYEVSVMAELSRGGRRTWHPILCTAEYDQESGWQPAHVSVGG